MNSVRTNCPVEMKLIPDFPGYFATKDGRIWSDAKYDKHHGKFLKPRKHYTGYLMAILYRDGKRYDCYVHRLVLEAWVGSCPPGFEANHKDNNRINNYPENLEWITIKGNNEHRVKSGRQARGEKCGAHKLTPAQVLEIRKLLNHELSIRKIARMFGIGNTTVFSIKSGRCWA